MNRGFSPERLPQPARIERIPRPATYDTRAAREIAEAMLDRLLIRKSDRWSVVRLAEVNWTGGAGNYVELHLGTARHLHRQTLAGLEPLLDPRRFARIHRSTIVNLDRIAELRPSSS